MRVGTVAGHCYDVGVDLVDVNLERKRKHTAEDDEDQRGTDTSVATTAAPRSHLDEALGSQLVVQLVQRQFPCDDAGLEPDLAVGAGGCCWVPLWVETLLLHHRDLQTHTVGRTSGVRQGSADACV